MQIEIEVKREQGLPNGSTLDHLIAHTNTTRSGIVGALDRNDRQSASELQRNYLISLPQYAGVQAEVRTVVGVVMEYFYFELAAGGEGQAQIEKQLLRKAEKCASVYSTWTRLKHSLVFASSALQLQLKLVVSNRRKVSLDELLRLEEMARQMIQIHPASLKYARSLMNIISHLSIYKLNVQAKHDSKLIFLCNALIRDEEAPERLFTLETRIALLYNCLKTILGTRELSRKCESTLLRAYETFKIKSVQKYEEHLLHLFFIIKGLISKKGQSYEGAEEANHEEGEEGIVDRKVAERLSIWTSVSLDETALALEEATRSIIRHRVASLATVIGMKLSLPHFCRSFLELMHDSPFNNEAQTIKLCFELFEAREYERLNGCLQVILSSPSCKHLREREVLVSLCAIFTGLCLNDREGALLYAKLNHHQNKKLILCEETLLQHVGFAYLNLATHEPYTANKEVFETLALKALKASAKVNPKNYLTQYSLGKLLIKMGDLDGAYTHAKESLMSGRGESTPFSLLACVYFCQRRFSKATALIDELLKKYKGEKYLHYIRAYIEVNHLLLEVEHDEQVEAAKQLGDSLYDLARERVLKNKSPANLIRYCQEYHQLSLGHKISEFDEKYFANVPSMSQTEMGMMETFAGGYQEAEGEETLLQIIPLLLEAGQTYMAEAMIKSLPISPLKIYQTAQLHEIKGEKGKAIAQYKAVLNQQPYHSNSLINLSMLVENLEDAFHYVTIAEKYTSGNQLWLAKGMLLSRLGRIGEAHELFLREGETGWFEMQPDLLYYY